MCRLHLILLSGGVCTRANNVYKFFKRLPYSLEIFFQIFVVVFIYLLSFASTFYILLAEYESYRTFPISIVSTFMAMTSGPDYYELFLLEGAYPQLYYIKLVFLVLFVLVMSIVVNNTLIGLAVGDTNEVMKSAKLEKFLHKVNVCFHN